MKKLIILFALTLILGGCGGSAETAGTPEEETEAAVELAEETEDGEGQEVEFEVSKDVVTDADFDQFAEPSAGDTIATIKTSMGDVKVKFFQEDAPKAVENFVTHAKNGYFDGITFHRVIDNFMIQSGSKDGTGTDGESIWGENFEDEFTARLHNYRGALSMANAGPGTNSSQFFIVQAGPIEEDFVDFLKQISEFEEPMYMDNRTEQIVSGAQRFTQKSIDNYEKIGGTPFLDGGFPNEEGILKGHTVFGQVFEGMDVVDKIAATVPEEGATPTEMVTIEKIEIGTY